MAVAAVRDMDLGSTTALLWACCRLDNATAGSLCMCTIPWGKVQHPFLSELLIRTWLWSLLEFSTVLYISICGSDLVQRSTFGTITLTLFAWNLVRTNVKYYPSSTPSLEVTWHEEEIKGKKSAWKTWKSLPSVTEASCSAVHWAVHLCHVRQQG